MNKGNILQVMGPVVDVKFSDNIATVVYKDKIVVIKL